MGESPGGASPARSRIAAARGRAARGNAVRGSRRQRHPELVGPRPPGRGRPERVRGLRPLPPPLPDLQADGRGVRIAARSHRRHAGGRRRTRGGGRRLRVVHGSVPFVQGVRGRVPLARPLRPDDGGREGADRAPPLSPRAPPALARIRRRAPASVASHRRGVAGAGGAPGASSPHPLAGAASRSALPPAARGDRADRRRPGARHGGPPLGMRPGSLVPARERRDDSRPRAQRLARRRPPPTNLLRRVARALRPSRDGAIPRGDEPPGLRAPRRPGHPRQRGRMRGAYEGVRRPAPRRRTRGRDGGTRA